MTLVLALGACALPGASSYDEWQGFTSRVSAMEHKERQAQYNALIEHHQSAPSAESRLQLAYLGLFYPQLQAGDRESEGVMELLEAIDADHELAPIRDLLLRYAQLGQAHATQSQKLGALGRECELVASSLDDSRRESEKLEQQVTLCADQLEALKQIESVMSAPEPNVQARP